MNKQQDINKVLALSDGQSTTVFWSEGGGGVIYRDGDKYQLFCVPQYGGEEQFEGEFELGQEEQMVSIAHTWT